MSRLVGLMGKARSGKDTAADYLQTYGFHRYAFADPMKDMLEAVFGDHFRNGDRERPIHWLGKSPRQLMQTLGTEWGRGCVHPELWILLARGKWDVVNHMGESLVITDVRFANEAKMITDQGGILIELVRPDAEKVNAHISENNDMSGVARYTIINDGSFADLYSEIDRVMGYPTL